MTKEDLIKAHSFSANHKKLLKKDKKCGCFYCLRVFEPKEIKDWIRDPGGTAMCPYCGIDSVIGEHSGFPITVEFLTEMRKFFF